MTEEIKSKEKTAEPTPEIAKVVESKVEIKEDIVTPEKEEDFKPIETPMGDYKTSPLFYEIANYFSIEPSDYEKSSDKLSIITDWAIQEANSRKLQDILPIIRELEDTLAKPVSGETRIAIVYRYLRLAIKVDSFNKALNAFKR